MKSRLPPVEFVERDIESVVGVVANELRVQTAVVHHFLGHATDVHLEFLK